MFSSGRRKRSGNGKEKVIEAAKQDGTSIGNLLLRFKMVSPEELDEALMYQYDNPDIMLGEALVRLGKISRDELSAVCDQQNLLRTPQSERTDLILRRVHRASAETQDFMGTLENVQQLSLQVIDRFSK